MEKTQKLLTATAVTKRYGATQALSHADFQLCVGEVHALVGANGAGKSTFVRILSGLERSDAGDVRFGAHQKTVEGPSGAHRLGVRTIFQEPGIVPTLNALDNVLLGEEDSRWGWLQTSRQRGKATDLLRELGFAADPYEPAGRLRPADLQLIEIAKALFARASIVIMDEPTAALGVAERAHMHSVVAQLRNRQVGILYIAHDLDEVIAVSDRITVMRNGATVATVASSSATAPQLVELMSGGHVDLLERQGSMLGDEVLSLNGVSQTGRLHDVTMVCRAGEILGVTGLVGSGRTRLMNVIAGLERANEGTMSLLGADYRPESPRCALARGVALVPENRKRDSLLMDRPSTDSIMLARPMTRWGFMRSRQEKRHARSWMDRLKVKPSDPSATPASMSGGNQQKVSIAKALQSKGKVLILDEPGQGVDIAAKDQIFRALRDLAAEGRAVIVVSSEPAELAPLVDRLIVMSRGRVAGELAPQHISDHRVLELATPKSSSIGSS